MIRRLFFLLTGIIIEIVKILYFTDREQRGCRRTVSLFSYIRAAAVSRQCIGGQKIIIQEAGA